MDEYTFKTNLESFFLKELDTNFVIHYQEKSPLLDEFLCQKNGNALRSSTDVWFKVFNQKLDIYRCLPSMTEKKNFAKKHLYPMLVFVLLGSLRYMRLYQDEFKTFNEDIKEQKVYHIEDLRKLKISQSPQYEKTVTYVTLEDSCDCYQTQKNNGRDKILLLSETHFEKPLGNWQVGGLRQVKAFN